MCKVDLAFIRTTIWISFTFGWDFMCKYIFLMVLLYILFTVEDAIPELAVFKRHFNGLTKILFSTNLTPHLIQEGVIALADQEELDAKPTSSGKAAFVLPKVSSALAAGETGSFYRMLEVMKCHGNHDAQQLSNAIASELSEPHGGT